MKVKNYFLILIALLVNISLFAQNGSYDLSGTVSDETSATVPGVNVLVKGTSNGVTTDINGAYKLKVKKGDSVQFSSTGFATQTIAVTGQTSLNITLKEDVSLIDEFIVVGYGTRKKSHSTGAIAQIGGKEIAAVQANRADEALAGKLAGVLIQNQDGEPGADPKIQVRASSSISGVSNPLIVVDGFPISGNLSTVNANDIESMEVLKDAASAAIYGSRGANGVILVTTKKGKRSVSGKPTVSYNTYVSTSRRYVKDNINMTAGEWASTIESNVADGTFDVSEMDPVLLKYRTDAYANAPDVVAMEDWLFKNGTSMNHDIAIGGATKNVDYRASVGYLNTDGVALDQSFERYNARLNLNVKLNEKWDAGVTMNGFKSDRQMTGHDMRDLLRSYSIHPIYHTEASIAYVQQLDQQAQGLGYAAFDDGFRGGSDAQWNSSIYTLKPGMTAQDWHYGRSGNGIGGSGDAGPATKLDNTEKTQKNLYGNFNSFLQYKITDAITARTSLGGDVRETEDFFWRGLEFDSRARSTQTALDQTNVRRSSVLSETSVMYNKILKEKHDIGAVAGVEFQNFFIKGTDMQGTNVPFGLPTNFALLEPADISINERDETIVRKSVFGRVNYAFDNRYLASVSLRRDGDSRFGENNRWKTFPAASLGWNVHNESFFNSKSISNMKVRVSRGTLGTTAFLGAYSSLSLLNPQATIFGTGYAIPSDIANPNLTWQTNTETNYGLNLGFLQNRFTIGMDYYTSDVEDMLINQSVSEVFGTTSVALNSADVRSSGFELELGGVVIDKKNFTWKAAANFSTVNSEIISLGNLEQLPNNITGQSGRGAVFRNYIGGQVGEMWGIETTGEVEMKYMSDPTEYIGKQSGYSYAVDQNNDGVIDRTKTVEEGGDLVKIGQNTPDFYWGLNSQFAYKDFDFAFQFQGAQGGEVYNIDPLYYGSQWGRSLTAGFDADGDGKADHNDKIYIRNRDQSDALIQDASYVALRNLTIGYTSRAEVLKKVGFSSLRVYVASTNLLYIMANGYTSFNPEGVETTGGDYLGPTTYGAQVGASPVVRSFTFGVNANF